MTGLSVNLKDLNKTFLFQDIIYLTFKATYIPVFYSMEIPAAILKFQFVLKIIENQRKIQDFIYIQIKNVSFLVRNTNLTSLMPFKSDLSSKE